MNLLLFFTYGVSLKSWAEDGLLDREILLYKKLLDKDISINFITYGDKEDYKYQDHLGGIEIVPFFAFVRRPRLKIITFLLAMFLPLILRSKIKKADILKTNQMWGAWVPLLAKFLYKKPLLIRCGYEAYNNSIHRKDFVVRQKFIYLISLLAYHFADRVHVTTEAISSFIQHHFCIKPSKIFVFANYIDTKRFKPFDNFREKEENRILFIGRLEHEKNILNLLLALKDLPYGLDIIGDGELLSSLKAYTTQHGIDVRFLGRFPNNKLPELINEYKVFILPSLNEGHPKVLLEAMACGCAVIGTNVEGINEVIRHLENGYLCDTDATSIHNAIQVVMENKDLRKKMSKQARLYVEKYCSIEKLVGRELSAYKSILHIKHRSIEA